MKPTRWIAALAVAAVALPVSIWSLRAQQIEQLPAEAAAGLEHEGPLGVAEGIEAIPGRLLDLDGKTPLVAQRILFKDAATGEVLARAVSDGEGKFEAPALQPGAKVVMLVEETAYRVTVDLEQAPKFLNVVVAGDLDHVPLADLQPIKDSGGGNNAAIIGLGVAGGAAVVGGGVAAAIATADGDDDLSITSFTPSSP